MPHLDEGMLHAYLDDALPEDVELHLRACAECRTNLEKARLLRKSADTILAGAAPIDIAMPSFEELQARATAQNGSSGEQDGRQATGQRRSFHQLRTIAWAATVVLAVAVGWYARETVLNTGQGKFVSEDESSGRLTIPLPETEVDVFDASDEQVQTGLSEVTQEEVTPIAEHTERPEPPARAPEAAPSAAPPQVERIESTPSGAAGAAIEAGHELEEDASRARMLPQLASERAAAKPTVSLATGGRVEGAGPVWTSVDEATAGHILGEPVPTVEGLPVIGYAMSSLNGSRAIRVIQRLTSGQSLELVIKPEAETEVSADARKGVEPLDARTRTETESIGAVTVAHGDLSIRLSAALSSDSLRTLGQNISSER